MKLRGRRHWGSSVMIARVEYGSGLNAGTIQSWSLLTVPLRASVQGIRAEEYTQLGLTTLGALFWVRFTDPGFNVQPRVHGIEWAGKKYIVVHVRHATPGEDFEVLVEPSSG